LCLRCFCVLDEILSLMEVSAVVVDQLLLGSEEYQIWWRHDLYIEHVMRGELRSTLHLQFCRPSALTLLMLEYHDFDQ
jgi:hypothetical protein